MNEEVKKDEVKDVKSKKKVNWLFTVFACIATAVIVVLSMNIGKKLEKSVR